MPHQAEYETLPKFSAMEAQNTWSRLFLKIMKIQQHVDIWRHTGMDRDYNVLLSIYPEITNELTQLFSDLVRECREYGCDSPCFEYFTKYDILTDFLHVIKKDIPEGLFDLGIQLFGALLTHLPSSLFFHQNFSNAVKLLLKSLRHKMNDTMTSDMSKIFPAEPALIKALLEKIKIDSSLKSIFQDTQETIRIIVESYRSESLDIYNSRFPGMFIEAVSAGLYEEDFDEDLLYRLILDFGSAFCSDKTNKGFTKIFRFLERLVESPPNYSKFPLILLQCFKSHFVETVYSEKLKSSDINKVLERLLVLVNRDDSDMENKQVSDLLVIMISKTIKNCELRYFDASKLDSSSRYLLMKFYNIALSTKRLRGAFALKSPLCWMEPAAVHRNRLNMIFDLISKLNMPSAPFETFVSDLYKKHLQIADSYLTGGLKVMVGDGINEFPFVSETFKVLDIQNLPCLKSLYITLKTEFIRIAFDVDSQSSEQLRFVLIVMSLLDTGDLYEEYSGGKNSLISLVALNVKQGLAELERANPKQSPSLEKLLDLYRALDNPLDHAKWSLMSKNLDLRQYFLMHTLLRMAAILQTRAIRSPVQLLYE